MNHDTVSFNAVARRVLDNLNTAVLLLDDSLRLIYVNPAAEILLAASARQLYQAPIQGQILNSQALLEGLNEALHSGHPFTEREQQLELASGHQLTVDCTVTPLHEAHQRQELLIEVVEMDRHRRIVLEENLLSQHQASRALVRGLAHEVKNPLGGIRGAAQLLERELTDEALTDYTGIIISEADRLQNLLNQMLGPNTPSRRDKVNIHQVLERVRQLVLAEAPTTVHIHRDYDPSIPELSADADQLIQATLNIMRNAVQAVGKAGHVTLRSRALRQYTIGSRRHKLIVRVDIVDNGPGIPPDMLKNIFYPMVTARAEGTGLGLPIAQSLVNQHGGLIECSSRPGETVFTILLPLEALDEQA